VGLPSRAAAPQSGGRLRRAGSGDRYSPYGSYGSYSCSYSPSSPYSSSNRSSSNSSNGSHSSYSSYCPRKGAYASDVEGDNSLPNPFLDDWDNAGDAGGSGSGGSSSDDNKGGHIVDGSGGGHIDEDLYGVSDGEQEPRRLPKDKPDEPAHLDYGDSPNDVEINQSATHLRKQSPTSQTGLDAPDPRPSRADLASDSTASQLVKQLYSFQGCTSRARDAYEHKHAELHSQHKACSSLPDLLGLQTPSDSIPNILIESKFMESERRG
jgi:hypothetical protein